MQQPTNPIPNGQVNDKSRILLTAMNKESQQLEKDSPAALFEVSIIDPDCDVEKPPGLFFLFGVLFGTLGNISMITGKPKSMKSMLLSLFTAGASGGVTDLIQTAINGKTILYFDTEQSKYHATLQAHRIKRLSNGNYKCIKYIALRQYKPSKRLEIIKHGIENTKNLAYVIIDGVTDLVNKGVNDEEEATTVVSKLMKWSEVHNIHITTILHQNKGDSNAKGHLGSYLVQKCETVLAAEKQSCGKISEIKPHFSRGIDIEPFYIAVDEKGMPYVTDYQNTAKDTGKAKKDPFDYELTTHRAIMEKVFQDKEELYRKELVRQLQYFLKEASINVGQNKIDEEWITYYINQKVLFQEKDRKPFTIKEGLG